MLKKTKLYVAIALIVQAISFAAMFIILCAKKKSIAFAFLALASLEGAAGAYLLKEVKEEEAEFDPDDFLDDEFELDDSMLSSAFGRNDEEEEEVTEA